MATITKIDAISLKKTTSYQVGFSKLDEILNGLKEGTIVTIGARPAMGKTTFVNQIILQLMEQYHLKTLYISLESSKEAMALRLASMASKCSYFEVKNNIEKRTKCMEDFQKKQYDLYISDDCFDIFELEQLLEENPNIKFLVIDYIQLMKSEKTFTSSTDSYNDVLDRIRVLASKYKLVIFLLSQISRNVECRSDKRPMLSDLRNSGNLENHSDVLLFLYRDSYYNIENNDSLEIIVAKNRYGHIAKTYLEYDQQKSEFIDY